LSDHAPVIEAQGMTYAIDPELLPWLDMLPQFQLTNYEELQAARAMRAQIQADAVQDTPAHDLDVSDTLAGDVPVRVYARKRREGPRPALLYIHGGGFVLGNLDMVDPAVRQMADELDIVVVSVDYRLAPEHPFPTPLEDCFSALTWMFAQANTLGIDTTRVGVAGESAGGGLSAGVALLARDRRGPRLRFQYLGIPELDDRLGTPSMTAYVDTPLWNRPKAVYSWASYLGEITPGGPDVPIYAAPARAEDLTGLPPAYVTACQFDPLRDEGIDYAQRLMHAGVPTELRHYPGTFHGSGMITEAAITKRMNADTLDALRRGLGA
jgi:acetyl esterase